MLSRIRTPLHFLALPLVAAMLAVSGCGGDEEASSPLDEALGYLSEDAGFAFVASTEVGDYEDVRKLLERFPFGGQIEGALEQGLEREGLDFEKDVEPLLGNELVVGTDENASLVDSSSETPVLLAIETRDGDKLKDLVERDAESAGSSDGYDLYDSGDSWAAVKDDVLVIAEDEQRLKDAIEQRGQDDRLTEEDVEPAFEDLPDDAPIKGYVNVQALLATEAVASKPETEQALKIKWLDQLETVGFAADATEDRVTLEYAAQTDPEGLSDEDLPIASATEPPRLLEREGGSAEVALSLRDPSQVIEFAQAAGKAANPVGYAQYQTGKDTIGRRLGVDVDRDVVDQLTGDLAAVVTLDQKFGVRAEVADPRAFERTLGKVMNGLPEFSDDVTVTPPRGDGFYRIATGDGETYAVGMAKGALVVANDAALASDVAARGLVEAEGLEGAFVATADAERVANEALAQFASGLGGLGGSLFTGPLGDLQTSAEASTEGIRGSLTLEIE